MVEPWAEVSDARVLHQQLTSSSPRSPLSVHDHHSAHSSPVAHSRSAPNLGRSPKKKRGSGGGGGGVRAHLPAISSPEQSGTPAFAMLQARTAVAQVRSLARLSSEKNEEIIKFGEHVNIELRALRKRMESQRQEDAQHETLEHRAAKAGGVVDDMREELSQLAQKRQKKAQLLLELTDALQTAKATVKGMSNSPADSPDAVRLGVVTAKYEGVEADRMQMVQYRGTLVTLHKRARRACSGTQSDIEQLQGVIHDASGEIESMKETLRLLQAVHISTNNERNQYLKSLVMDKMVHAEQLKMRQRMITMERQVDIDNKKREEARIRELNRPKEQAKRKNLAAAAGIGFQKQGLAKAREETGARERALQAGMRRLEVETGITTAEELIKRWEQHEAMSAEQQNTAVGTKRRLHEVEATKARFDEELQALVLMDREKEQQKTDSAAAVAAPSGAKGMASFERQNALLQAATGMVSERMEAAEKTEALLIRVRETLLGMLLRVCPRETRSTHWAAMQWDKDPIDVVNEISMVVHAMGTEICGGEMPTQEYIDSKVAENSDWQNVIISNMESDDFRKYNTRVAPINLHHGNYSGVTILSEKAGHAPTAVAAEDHRAHFGRGHFKASEILSNARRAGMIDESIDNDPYGMRGGGGTDKKQHTKKKAGAHQGAHPARAVQFASGGLGIGGLGIGAAGKQEVEEDVGGPPLSPSPTAHSEGEVEPSSEQYMDLGGPDFEV
jgi:hypothetical protein